MTISELKELIDHYGENGADEILRIILSLTKHPCDDAEELIDYIENEWGITL